MYIPRASSCALQRYLKVFSAVGLTGPRQSGKSTILKHLLKDYTYVSFDDAQNINFFESDPVHFMKTYSNKVIFDEVQFVPELFHAIKLSIDEDRQNYGKFVLTGSSQFSLVQNITESLAGRIGLMHQLPFQYSEMPASLKDESIYQGAYPELVMREYMESQLWYGAYMDTYLMKDVRTMANIGDIRDFRRLISLLAANTSAVLDMTNYAKAIGVSLPTIKRWISILEASYIIFLLPAYHTNLSKRVTKRPKIYFYDTGLVSYLTGVSNFELYDQGPMAGSLFENYVILEILKKLRHNADPAELFFMRTQDGAEIDLIIDHKTSRTLIEIKKSSTFRAKMISTLKQFALPKDHKILLYQGDSIQYADAQVMHYKDFLFDSNGEGLAGGKGDV